MTAGASCPHAYLGSSLFQSKDVRGAQYSLFLFCARATRVGPPDHSHDRITSQSTVDHTTRPFQTLRPSTPSQFECVVCVYSYVVEQRLELWCARPHVPYSEVVPRRRHQVARCAHGPLLRTPHHLGCLMETSAYRSEINAGESMTPRSVLMDYVRCPSSHGVHVNHIPGRGGRTRQPSETRRSHHSSPQSGSSTREM